ncbi:hypothetical protein J8273_7630, partial [Carpediemonas membranifera]
MDYQTISAPFLNDIRSETAFCSFNDKFEAYSAQVPDDRALSVRMLISSRVLRLIRLRIDNFDDLPDENVLSAIYSAFFAPKSTQAVLSKLEATAMSSTTASNSALLAYLDRFDRVEDLCSTYLPDEKTLRRTFIRGLSPDSLRRRVKASEPETLADAKRAAFQEVETLAEAKRTIAEFGQPEVPRPQATRPPPSFHPTRPHATAAPAPHFPSNKPDNHKPAGTPAK